MRNTGKWAVSFENASSGICGQRRPRSDCASAQSDQGLRRPLTESLDTIACITGEQRLGGYFAHAQDDLNLRILRVFGGTFSLGAAQIVVKVVYARNRGNK